MNTSRLQILARISLAHVQRQRVRVSITAAGIALGVASVVAILGLTRSIYQSFENTVETLAGQAQIQIANGAAGVPEDLLRELEVLPGVAAAAGVVQEFVRLPSLDRRQVCLLGVDLMQQVVPWEGDFSREAFRVQRETDVFAEAGSVILSDVLLEQTGRAVGDTLEVVGPRGPFSLTVRGSLGEQRFGRLFQGAVGIMDILPAQITFGKEGKFDWIDIAVSPGADVESVRTRARGLVKGRAQVSSPATRGQRVEAVLSTLRWILAISSLLAITVGVFLGAHSMHSSTRQRSDALATLRCLGASRGDLALLVLAESGLVAAAGTVVGVPVGIALSWAALGPFSAFVSATYLQVEASGVIVGAEDVLVGVGVAVVATFAGALLPMIASARTPPIQGVERYASGRQHAHPGIFILGSAVVVCGIALPSLRFPREWFMTQTVLALAPTILMLLGVTLLMPIVLRAAAFVLRPLLRRAWGPVGQWLWEQIARGGRSEALTLASLTGGFAFAFLMGVVAASYRTAVVQWIETSFAGDMVMSTGRGISLLSGPVVSVTAAEEIAAVSGVSAAMPVRFMEADLNGKPIIIQGIADELLAQQHPGVRLGTAEGGVIISDTLMERTGLRQGDRFVLDTPTGEIALTVSSVEPDYLLDLGSVKLPWTVFSERWREERANFFVVRLEDPAEAARIKAAIDSGVGERFDLTVYSWKETRDVIDLLIAGAFGLTFACELLAIAVALCSVLNSVAANLMERRGDLRILRTLGLTPRGLRRLTMTEGATLGGLGASIGLVIGAISAERLLRNSAVAVAGFHLPLVWPFGTAMVLLALGAATGTVGAFMASREI